MVAGYGDSDILCSVDKEYAYHRLVPMTKYNNDDLYQNYGFFFSPGQILSTSDRHLLPEERDDSYAGHTSLKHL